MLKLKTRWSPSGKGFRYVIYGDDVMNEIACFPHFLQAALVIRYLSGADMNEQDAAYALAAISEFDGKVEDEEIQREDPFVPEQLETHTNLDQV